MSAKFKLYFAKYTYEEGVGSLMGCSNSMRDPTQFSFSTINLAPMRSGFVDTSQHQLFVYQGMVKDRIQDTKLINYPEWKRF